MKHIVVILLIGVLYGCSTIEFVNGPKMDETVVRHKWHHLGFNGLIEYSKPMNVTYYCADKQWDSITVEQTFLNNFVSISWPYFSIYTPWTIEYECREPID